MDQRIFDADFVSQLRAIVGDSGLVTGEALASRNPGVFMSKIEAGLLVRPASTEEVSRVLRLCHERRQSVVVQGGMSGWVRATQTTPRDLILSMERMNAIEDIDPANRTATVQAGVVLETLQDKVEAHGLIFALDLGGRGSCQVGGNASTNAGGVRVIRYGMMREQVLGVEAVLADGRIVSSLNRMIKNNTGYDLKQLFIGSEGTLGVITRLVLRLRERPVSVNTALVCVERFDQLAALLRHMDAVLGGQLSAFEMMDTNFYDVNTREGRHRAPLPAGMPYYAIIESLGADQAHDAELFERGLGLAIENGLVSDAVIGLSGRERDDIWVVREDLEHIVRDFRPFHAFDVSLPVGDMEAYMQSVRTRVMARWPEGAVAFLGHVGDGNLHIAIGAGTEQEGAEVEACVYEPLVSCAGSVSAEHGIGLEKKPWLSISRNDEERRLMRQLKRALDPHGILNPGKIFDVADSAEG